MYVRAGLEHSARLVCAYGGAARGAHAVAQPPAACRAIQRNPWIILRHDITPNDDTLAGAARKLDQSAARKLSHLRAVHSTLLLSRIDGMKRLADPDVVASPLHQS